MEIQGYAYQRSSGLSEEQKLNEASSESSQCKLSDGTYRYEDLAKEFQVQELEPGTLNVLIKCDEDIVKFIELIGDPSYVEDKKTIKKFGGNSERNGFKYYKAEMIFGETSSVVFFRRAENPLSSVLEVLSDKKLSKLFDLKFTNCADFFIAKQSVFSAVSDQRITFKLISSPN